MFFNVINDRVFNFFVIILFFLGHLFISNNLYADSVDWLESQSQTDGSYANENDISFALQSTVEILRTYDELEQTTLIGIVPAQNYISNITTEKVELLSRKIISSVIAGGNYSLLIQQLVQLQNNDGGFGDQVGYQSQIIDTAFAVEALGIANFNDSNVLSKAINYLFNNQLTDGSFSHSSENESSIYETALVSIALQQFRFTFNLSAELEQASQYLLTHQVSDGNWGTIWETAYALLALVPITSNVQLYQSAVNYLENIQQANGSWDNDVYTTALVLRAIDKAKQVDIPITSTAGVYTGSIFNASTGQPLQGVEIKLTDIANFGATSLADGSFIISDIPAGKHNLSYTASGFSSTGQLATAFVSKITSLGIIQLAPITTQGFVFGVIRDATTNQPLSAIDVNISGSTNTTVQTNNEGYFGIEVAPGDIQLLVQSTVYDTVSGGANILAGQRLNFSPQLHLIGTAPVSIGLVSASIMVVDSNNNKPISNATVAVSGTTISATTNNQGQLILENISPGTFTIEISATDYQAVNASGLAFADTIIDLGVVRLNKQSAVVSRNLTGLIVDAETRQPISGATVSITGGTSVVTNAEGFYLFENIAQTNFELVITAVGYLKSRGNIEIGTVGLFTVNATLNVAKISQVNISSLTTNQASYSANSETILDVEITNEENIVQEVRLYVLVINDQSVLIDQFSIPNLEIIAASTVKKTEIEWRIGRNPPGFYQIKVQAIDAETGQLLSEKALQIEIEKTFRIGGSASFKPPLVQQIANQTVDIEGLFQNTGNQPIPAGQFTATVTLERQGNERSSIAGEVSTLDVLNRRNAIQKIDSDSKGNTYIPDGNKILKIDPDGNIEELLLATNHKVVDIDITTNNEIYILSSLGKIGQYDLATSTDRLLYETTIASPTSIEVLSDGRILVGSSSKGVYEVSVTGIVTQIHQNGMTNSQGMVKDSQGRLFISDSRSGLFKYENGVLNHYLAELQDSSLRGMAIDSLDNLYIAAYATNEILKITPDKVITTYATNIETPWALSFDNLGRLLVSSYQGNQIIAVNPDGSQTIIVKETINTPQNMVHGNDGSVYIIDQSRNLIEFDNQGNFIRLFNIGSAGAAVKDMLFETEQRILVLTSNKLYTVSAIDGNTEEITAGLTVASSISKEPSGLGYVISERDGNLSLIDDMGAKSAYRLAAFSNPIKIVIAPSGDKYVLNRNYISKIAPNGEVSRLIDHLPSTTNNMTIASNGEIFITTSSSKIFKISIAGIVTEYATLTFRPSLITIKNDGTLFLLSSDGKAIFKVDTTGTAMPFITMPNRVTQLTMANDDFLWMINQSLNQVSKVAMDATIEVFAINKPTALIKAPLSGIDIITRVDGLKHYSNIGDLTTVFTNSLFDNKNITSMVYDGTDYWLFQLNSKTLFKVATNGDLLNTYSSTSIISDFIFLTDGSIIVADNQLLKIPALHQLPVILDAGRYIKVKKFIGDNLLLSTIALLKKIDLNTLDITTFISGFRNLHDYSLSPNETQVVTIDSRNNELRYHQADGSLEFNHIGLNKPKAILYTPDGKVLVSNNNPSKIMQVATNGDLSIFSNLEGILYLSNLPNNQISAFQGLNISVLSSLGLLDETINYPSIHQITSPIIVEGTDWFVVANGGELFKINADKTTLKLATGVASIVDIETDNTGIIYLLDSRRHAILESTITHELKLVFSDLLPTLKSFSFSTSNIVYIAEGGDWVSSLDLSTLKKYIFIATPLIKGVTGTSLVNGDLKLFGSSFTLSFMDKTLYSVALNDLSRTIPAGGVVYTKQLTNNLMNAGEPAIPFDFGSFVPPVSGDYKVVITHSDSRILSTLINSLHVGGAALGKLVLTKDHVFPGDKVVAGSLSITGADSTSITKLEPENIILAVSSQTRGRAITSDSVGNIYAADTNRIVKISADGVVSDFVTNISVGEGLVIDHHENIYAINGMDVLKINPQAEVSTYITLDTDVRALAIDTDDKLFAATEGGKLLEIHNNGTTTIILPDIKDPHSLSIDVFGNFYYLSGSSTILKYNPSTNKQSIAYIEKGLRFELEGVNVITDCSNNILFAPFRMPSINHFREEDEIIQITGSTGNISQVLYGPDVDPALSDMDVLYYDHFNDRVLVWTDLNNGKIFSIPASCGSIDVEAHLITQGNIDINGFDPVPTRSEVLKDGTVEHIWVLSEVDNRGNNIEFNALFKQMTEGESRPVFKDAYLLFTNNFIPEQQVKTALDIPELLAISQSTLTTTLNQSSYIANQDIDIILTVGNQSDALLNGYIKLVIVNQADEIVHLLDNVSVTNVPVLGQEILITNWNTELTLTGDYKLLATLYSSNDIILQETVNPFKIQASENNAVALAQLRISVDKIIYNVSDLIKIESLAQNITANGLLKGVIVSIKIFTPDNQLYTELEQTIGDLNAGNIRQTIFEQQLATAPFGIYTIQGELKNAAGNLLATDETTLEVKQLEFALNGTVQSDQDIITEGVDQSCTNIIRNIGTLSLTDTNFRQVVVNLDTSIENIYPVQVISTATGDQTQFITDINNASLSKGVYACILQYQKPNSFEWQTLSNDTFKVQIAADNTPSNTALKAVPSVSKWGMFLLILMLLLFSKKPLSRLKQP